MKAEAKHSRDCECQECIKALIAVISRDMCIHIKVDKNGNLIK